MPFEVHMDTMITYNETISRPYSPSTPVHPSVFQRVSSSKISRGNFAQCFLNRLRTRSAPSSTSISHFPIAHSLNVSTLPLEPVAPALSSQVTICRHPRIIRTLNKSFTKSTPSFKTLQQSSINRFSDTSSLHPKSAVPVNLSNTSNDCHSPCSFNSFSALRTKSMASSETLRTSVVHYPGTSTLPTEHLRHFPPHVLSSDLCNRTGLGTLSKPESQAELLAEHPQHFPLHSWSHTLCSRASLGSLSTLESNGNPHGEHPAYILSHTPNNLHGHASSGTLLEPESKTKRPSLSKPLIRHRSNTTPLATEHPQILLPHVTSCSHFNPHNLNRLQTKSVPSFTVMEGDDNDSIIPSDMLKNT